MHIEDGVAAWNWSKWLFR